MTNSFASGFMQAFGEGMIRNQQIQRQDQERQRQQELWDLQKKKMLADFELTRKKSEALGDLSAYLDPSLPADQAGPVQPPTSLMDALATPKGQKLALMSGMADLGDIQKAQQQKMLMDYLSNAVPGFNAPGATHPQQDQSLSGMMAGGFEIDPFAALGGQFKGVAPQVREITQPDGSKKLIRVGQVSGQVYPIGGGDGIQSAPSPQDVPISFEQLSKLMTSTGESPPPGTTGREVIESGQIKVRPGKETVTMNRGGTNIIYERNKDTGELKFIGMEREAPRTPEQAGKISAFISGQSIAKELQDNIIGQDGKVKIDLNTAMQMQAPTFGSLPSIAKGLVTGGDIELPGRMMRRQFDDAIDSVIRARTGAAATEGEMNKLIDQFMPTVIDISDPKLVKDKLDRLNKFLNGALDVVSLPKSISDRLKPEFQDVIPILDTGTRPDGVPAAAELVGQRGNKKVWILPNNQIMETTDQQGANIDLGGSIDAMSQDEINALLQYMTPEQQALFK